MKRRHFFRFAVLSGFFAFITQMIQGLFRPAHAQTWQKVNANRAETLNTANTYQVNGLGVGTAASATAGEIRATNNITAYFSDYRLKENIRPIENPLAKISQISGVYYTNNKRAQSFGYTDLSQQVGVIAQEIQTVLPEIIKPAPFDSEVGPDGKLVSRSGENYMTVQYEKIVPLLIESIKVLNERIEQLERNR
jgi:hypothetical protein